MQEKYITTDQIKIIVEGAPKGVDKERLVQSIVNKGYVIQGYNDQEYEKKKQQGTFGQRLGKDLTGRIEDVGVPVKTAFETATDASITPTQRVIGAAAELGKVPLRATGAVFGAAGDVVGEAVKSFTGDTQVKTLEQQRAENPLFQKVASVVGQEGARTAGDIFNTVGGEVASVAIKPIAKVASKAFSKIPEIKTPNLKSSIGSFVDEKVKSETSELLNSTKSLAKATKLAQSRGIPLSEIVADPTVFKGIKVESGKINPTEAVQVLDDRIETLVTAKKSLLPEFDRLVVPQSREVLRQRAYADIAGKFTPADEKVLKASIDNQIDSLPTELKVSDIDSLRAKFRNSARDARGLQKSSSEYSALENAARDTVFDLTDELPVDNAAEYKVLNDSIKQWIGAKDFLENNLAGQSVKGGRLQNLFARGVGAVAGSQGGAIGAILGSEAGGAISNIIVNNQLGSSIKMKLIREITDDPDIIKQAEKLVEQAKSTNLLSLPGPSGKVGATGKEVIESLPARTDRAVGFQDQKK